MIFSWDLQPLKTRNYTLFPVVWKTEYYSTAVWYHVKKEKEKQVPFTGNTKMKYYDWRQQGQKYLVRL